MYSDEFKFRDIRVRDDYYDEDGSKKVRYHDQIPAHMIECNPMWDYEEGTDSDSGIAHALGYSYKKFNSRDYLVVELNACEAFVFERWYLLDAEYNEELFDMLEAVRALRFHDGKLDVSMLTCHDFCFKIKKCPNANTYRIFDVSPEPMSYEFNICCNYDKNKVMSELMELANR